MVIQQFDLFGHITILQNCMLVPMRSRCINRQQAEAIAIK